MQPTYETQGNRKLISIIVAIVVIAGVVLLADHLKAQKAANVTATTAGTTSQPAVTQTTPSSTDSSTATSSSAYKDGTYTASSSYYVPHGSEEIQVNLTLKNGVITDSSITNSEGDHDSAAYQEEFAASYKNYVVGKSISGLRLGSISGASDTTQGFNDALSQIATKAQA